MVIIFVNGQEFRIEKAKNNNKYIEVIENENFFEVSKKYMTESRKNNFQFEVGGFGEPYKKGDSFVDDANGRDWREKDWVDPRKYYIRVYIKY